MTSLLCVTLALPAASESVSVQWHDLVRAIAHVESRTDHNARGDWDPGRKRWRSRGAWQMGEPAWKDVNAVRRMAGRRIHSWRQGAHVPHIAREYAYEYLSIQIGRLGAGMGRPPTVQEIYAAWRLGAQGFARREYSLALCPETVRDGARSIEAYILRLRPRSGK